MACRSADPSLKPMAASYGRMQMNLAAPCFSLRCPTPKPHESFSGSSPECRAAIRSFSTGSFAMGALWRASGKRYFSPPRPTPSNRVFSTTVSIAGKRIFEGRDKEPERASKVQERRCGDRISLSNPPIQGLFDENREISVRPRVCGGGCSRHRTSLLSKFPANKGATIN